MNRICIGADIGGSHITCRLFDLDRNVFYDNSKVRISVDCNSTKDEILNGWSEAIFASAKGLEIKNLTGIGFAMPGPFDYNNGIGWFKDVKKFDALYGVDIRSELISRLGLRNDFPIRFRNDAVCFAIGESLTGKAAEYRRILAITLGTGFGTTFIDNHLPVAGMNGVPEDGFLYHIPIGNAIADDYFSTRWFLKAYRQLFDKEVKGVQDLAEMAITDKKVGDIFRSFGVNLGIFLAPWLKNFDAGCLVIGGNISSASDLFKNELEQTLEDAGLDVMILISALGEEVALMGSARLCDNEFYKVL